MNKIVELKTRPAQTNEQAIIILRDMLASAERGDVVAVAVAALEPGGASRTQCSASEHFQGLLGAVTILQFRMLCESRSPDLTV